MYGILEMALMELRARIEVDYSQQDPSAVFRLPIDCGKAALEEEPSLSLLFLSSGSQRNPGLTFWCPDLDVPPARSFCLWEGWKAGTSDDPEEEKPWGAWFEPDGGDLHAMGCRVGIVSQALSSTFCWTDLERDAEIPSIEDSTQILLWENECLILCTQTFTEQERVPLFSILTLCEGYMTRLEDDLEIMHKAYIPADPYPLAKSRKS
jgi:hypothetical protein